MAIQNQAKLALANNINNAITQAYDEVTAETALKFSMAYCVNRRARGDSIEIIVAPFQRIYPVCPIYNWSFAVMFVAYAVWDLCKYYKAKLILLK